MDVSQCSAPTARCVRIRCFRPNEAQLPRGRQWRLVSCSHDSCGCFLSVGRGSAKHEWAGPTPHPEPLTPPSQRAPDLPNDGSSSSKALPRRPFFQTRPCGPAISIESRQQEPAGCRVGSRTHTPSRCLRPVVPQEIWLLSLCSTGTTRPLNDPDRARSASHAGRPPLGCMTFKAKDAASSRSSGAGSSAVCTVDAEQSYNKA